MIQSKFDKNIFGIHDKNILSVKISSSWKGDLSQLCLQGNITSMCKNPIAKEWSTCRS